MKGRKRDFGSILTYFLGKISADHIAHIEVMYDNGYEKHQVISDCDMPKDLQLN